MSAATLVRDFAVILRCCCSCPDSVAVCMRVVFTCKTSGKSTSKTSLSFKQPKRSITQLMNYAKVGDLRGSSLSCITTKCYNMITHVTKQGRSDNQPAPRRTTCASLLLKELRAASICESNQRVRMARITPEISLALFRRSCFIFS